ncbi:hypothetical protein LUW76_40640 [Actinomadura madurae]|uniref:hypothetical protein n=1 Tax=Actinomadura madurae TaxID=1993 RepID=UPI002026E347|nr:hypothetical protein [Actinomadura madurae]URN00120.1 hypothetical protein LUW76_40640 [Actinomadura madurae]
MASTASWAPARTTSCSRKVRRSARSASTASPSYSGSPYPVTVATARARDAASAGSPARSTRAAAARIPAASASAICRAVGVRSADTGNRPRHVRHSTACPSRHSGTIGTKNTENQRRPARRR